MEFGRPLTGHSLVTTQLSGPSCSKPGLANPGLARTLI